MSRAQAAPSRHHDACPARARGLRRAARRLLQAFGLASGLHAAVFLHALEERGPDCPGRSGRPACHAPRSAPRRDRRRPRWGRRPPGRTCRPAGHRAARTAWRAALDALAAVLCAFLGQEAHRREDQREGLVQVGADEAPASGALRRERALPSPISLRGPVRPGIRGWRRSASGPVAVGQRGTAPSGLIFRNSGPLSSSRLSLCVS